MLSPDGTCIGVYAPHGEDNVQSSSLQCKTNSSKATLET